MENSITTFILIIATLLIGLSAFAITSVFTAQQYNNVQLQNQAENIANGLYISEFESINNSYSLTVYDFNYHRAIFFTVFYVPNVYENDTAQITPQFAYTTSTEGIVYPKININYTEVQVGTLYYTNLKPLYQGNIMLWEVPSLSSPAPIVVTGSILPNYTPVIIFFAQIQNKYVEVGYQWL